MHSRARVAIGILVYFAFVIAIQQLLPSYLTTASGGGLSHRDATLPVVVAATMGLVGILVGLIVRK